MRLLTRSDFDGLACAVLLEELGLIDEYKFVHPKDVQDGKIEVSKNDILANIPFVPGCGIWFDHHSSEYERLKLQEEFDCEGASQSAPSCARVVYEYYGGADKFSRFDETGLMAAVDKSDSADFAVSEILEPEGWNLLSFIMDARSGLGRYRDYRISNYALMMDMIKYCATMSAEEILQVPDVQERVERYFEQEEPYKQMLQSNSRAEGNVIVIDFRKVEEFLSGNRFVEYALFPDQNVSVRAIWGREKQNVVITVGHSIITRTCATDIGMLMLEYGGGGHSKVGTCQRPTESADQDFADIIAHLQKNG